jgi:hypothetical protein
VYQVSIFGVWTKIYFIAVVEGALSGVVPTEIKQSEN